MQLVHSKYSVENWAERTGRGDNNTVWRGGLQKILETFTKYFLSIPSHLINFMIEKFRKG